MAKYDALRDHLRRCGEPRPIRGEGRGFPIHDSRLFFLHSRVSFVTPASSFVTPAKAGVQCSSNGVARAPWIPPFGGMTSSREET